ncbi:MAG TPA: 3-hydroxybutyryl-CoA dehydrogenase [Myxococcales bacterium]|jgi:3-hydroxybutyryl-CoA dehydrogenase|nr:3-hydroxybutyryl-CoA dehydrogenase [Myxococcales bacterium]
MAIQSMLVVGAGQMGSGIAQVAAQAGLEVTIVDVSPQALERAQERIKAGIEKAARRGAIKPDEVAGILARVKTATGFDSISVDMAVEAVTENEALKREIFASLDQVVKPGGVIATNTSSLPITRLATATKRPDAVIGMHFMNPVPMMALVEIIHGAQTSEQTFESTVEVAKRMGKTAVVARDFPGFIVNRVLIPYLNEACYALMEGVGSVEDIDAAMKLGTNVPMGPFTLADFIGLDTCLSIMEVLHKGLGDDKYRPCPLLRQYVDAGWLGKKTGRGFYKY